MAVVTNSKDMEVGVSTTIKVEAINMVVMAAEETTITIIITIIGADNDDIDSPISV